MNFQVMVSIVFLKIAFPIYLCYISSIHSFVNVKSTTLNGISGMSKLKQIATIHSSKTLIVAANNSIVLLKSKDLSIYYIKSIGPVLDSIFCSNDSCLYFLCPDELKDTNQCKKHLTNTVVKAWTFNESHAFICYNIYHGYCVTIDLFSDNLRRVGYSKSIVTPIVESHTTMLYFKDRIFIASEIQSSRNYMKLQFNSLSIHTTPNYEFVKSPLFFALNAGRMGFGFNLIYPLEFQGSFNFTDLRRNSMKWDYIFFLTNQPENKLEPKDGKFQVRLSRICAKDETFSSFIDVGLTCGKLVYTEYYKVESWSFSKVGSDLSNYYRSTTRFSQLITEKEADFDHVLFINFKVVAITSNELKTLNKVVTCAYPAAEIMELFDIIKHRCDKGLGSVNIRPFNINSNEDTCRKEFMINEQQGFCGGAKIVNMHIIGDHYGNYSGIGRLVEGIDGIRVTTINVFPINQQFTVSFIGTKDGSIYQREYFQNYTKPLDKIQLFNSEIKDMFIDQSSKKIYSISHDEIAMSDIVDCNKMSSCGECVKFNPYCGWCSYLGQCVMKSSCRNNFWIHYNQNKCPEIYDLPASSIDNHTSNGPLVKFFVRNFPAFEDLTFRTKCKFIDRQNNSVMFDAYFKFEINQIVCKGPSTEDIDLSIDNSGYSVLQLLIYVNERYLMETDYTIFDCSKYTSCSNCSQSQFKCSWCIKSNKCISKSNMCDQKLTVQSNQEYYCPQIDIINQNKFHIHQPITLTMNVKHFQVYKKYSINVFCFENCLNRSVAANFNNQYLICKFDKIDKIFQSQQNCDLKIILESNNNFIKKNNSYFSLKFEMYDCSQMAQYCDDCVFLSTVYNCGFCKLSKKCSFQPFCSSEFINNENQYCPSPFITQIIPSNSTLKSESIIIIKGRNLGFYRKDIVNRISLEDDRFIIGCRFIDEAFIKSKQFKCQIQKKPEKISTPISFQFIYRSNSLNLAKMAFHFYEPEVNSIDPSFGPLFGGTKIRISGKFLDIGNERRVVFKSSDNLIVCTVEQYNSTTIECIISNYGKYQNDNINRGETSLVIYRTKRSIKNAALYLIIDKYEKSFTDITYRFYPNPTKIKVSRNKFFYSAGQQITFDGENLNYIHQPCISLICDHYSSNCKTCLSLNMSAVCLTPQIQYRNYTIACTLKLGIFPGLSYFYETKINLHPLPKITLFQDLYGLPSKSISFFQVKNDLQKLSIKFHYEDPYFIPINPNDLTIKIGSEKCILRTISTIPMTCEIFTSNISSEFKYPVEIKMGNFHYNELGELSFYETGISIDSKTLIIIIAFIIFVLVVLASIILALLKKFHRKSKSSKRNNLRNIEEFRKKDYDQVKIKLIELNSIVELNELTIKNWKSDPIHPFNIYILYNFFPKTHPRRQSDPTTCNEIDTSDNSTQFSSIFDNIGLKYYYEDPLTHPLLFPKNIKVTVNIVECTNKLFQLFDDNLFVLTFFPFIDKSKETDLLKSEVISLLSIILMKNMNNYTTILKILIKNHYEICKQTSEERNMFRQSDLLSKFLSNWLIILMYDELKLSPSGGDLLLLYLSLLNVINSGPVDPTTQKSYYAFNNTQLLDREVKYHPMKVLVKYPSDFVQEGTLIEKNVSVELLDSDTITQSKLKILEKIFTYNPYSDWLKSEDIQIEIENEDIDQTEKLLSNEVFYNSVKTLSDVGIKDGDTLRIFYKSGLKSVNVSLHNGDSGTNSIRTINSVNKSKIFSTLSNNEHSVDYKETSQKSQHPHNKSSASYNCLCSKKQKSESNKNSALQCNLINCLILKQKVERYITKLFDGILGQDTPYFIKDLFSSFHEYCQNESIIFCWKSNSLILRFWIQIITNLDYLFDIPLVKHKPVFDCLVGVGKVLMDICSQNLSKETWLTQLFYQIIMEYKPKVSKFYEGIHRSPNNQNYTYETPSTNGINISLAVLILYDKFLKNVNYEFKKYISESTVPRETQTEWIQILNHVEGIYEPWKFIHDNGEIKTEPVS